MGLRVHIKVALDVNSPPTLRLLARTAPLGIESTVVRRHHFENFDGTNDKDDDGDDTDRGKFISEQSPLDILSS